MSFLETILGSTGIKEKILKQFTDSFKSRGVGQVLIEILPNDKIEVHEIIDGAVVVTKYEYEFLKQFYNDHK